MRLRIQTNAQKLGAWLAAVGTGGCAVALAWWLVREPHPMVLAIVSIVVAVVGWFVVVVEDG